MQLLVTLAPEPQTVAQVCKRLRMKRPELERVIAENRAGLDAWGMVLHVATHSDVARAIKLASISNAAEPTYYGKLSREAKP